MGETGKPDVDDISLDDARAPRKKSGTSAVLGLVLLIVIAVIVLFMAQAHKAQMEAAKKAKDDATASRAAALSVINGQVKDAITDAQAGNLDSGISKLDAVEAKLGLIISEANGVGDQEAAKQAMDKRQAVLDARKGLVEVRDSIAEKLGPLGAAFGITVAPATGSAPAAGAEGSAPPAAPQGAAATPPAAEGNTPATPPASGAPAAPGQAPSAPPPAAPPTPAPAAPAAPVPAAS